MISAMPRWKNPIDVEYHPQAHRIELWRENDGDLWVIEYKVSGTSAANTNQSVPRKEIGHATDDEIVAHIGEQLKARYPLTNERVDTGEEETLVAAWDVGAST